VNGVIGTGNAGGGAPTGAQYVVLVANATLTQERVLTGGSGITLTDAGAGGAATLALTWGAPTIGTIEPDDAAGAGASANPARSDHQHAIVNAAPVGTITEATGNTEGAATSFARSDHAHDIDVSATRAPHDAQYVVMALDATLTNERVLTGSANEIVVTDSGAGAAVTLTAGPLIVQTDQANTWTVGSQIIQTNPDTVTAFQVLDADGGVPVLSVDTINERVGIGVAAPAEKLDISSGHIKIDGVGSVGAITLENDNHDLVIADRTGDFGTTGEFRLLPYLADIYFDNNINGDLLFRTNQIAAAKTLMVLYDTGAAGLGGIAATTAPFVSISSTGVTLINAEEPQLILSPAPTKSGVLRIGPGTTTTAVNEVYRVTNTLTGVPANYERLTFGFNQYLPTGTDAFIGTEKGGTGSSRALILLMGSTELMRLNTSSHMQIADAVDIVLNTTTGTTIAAAANQKLGFYGATPVVQRPKASYNNWAALGDVVNALVSLGLFDAA